MKTWQYLLLSILASYAVDADTARENKGKRGSTGSTTKSKQRGNSLIIRGTAATNTFCSIVIDGVPCSANVDCATGELCGTHEADDSWSPLDDDIECDSGCNCYCIADESSLNLSVEKDAAILTNDDTNVQNDDANETTNDDTKDQQDDNIVVIQQDTDGADDTDDIGDVDDAVTSKKKGNKSQKSGRNDEDDDDSPRKRNGNSKNRDDNNDDEDTSNGDDNDSGADTSYSSDSDEFDTTDSAEGDDDGDDDDDALAAVLNDRRMESKKVEKEIQILVENIWILIIGVVLINIGVVAGWWYSKRTRKMHDVHRFGSQSYALTEQEDIEEIIVNAVSDENV